MNLGGPPDPCFRSRCGALYHADALEWMASLPAGRARLVIADPPYNLGKAAWDSFGSQEEYLSWTRRWVAAARRLLEPDGTLYLCGYPEPLALIAAQVGDMFASWRHLVWFYRNKASMSDDWGRSHEGVLHFRRGRTMVFNTDAVRIPYNDHTLRYPERTQAPTSQFSRRGRLVGSQPKWRPHPAGARPRDVLEVPTLCNGSKEKTSHPTQKPEELIRKLLLASSHEGELVIDPFGGAGTTYAACEALRRRWLGCESNEEYCRLIASRLADAESFRALSHSETPNRRAARRALLRESR